MRHVNTNLRIGGFTPLTTIDYPDHLSCVVYTQGCSWRCRYCHNPELVYANKESNKSWQQVLNFLKNRQGLLEAVVFCGGEPLLQKNLYESMLQVKRLGFKIGLHTAGSLPKRFEQVLSLVDWVGFDIKDLPENVEPITQVKGSGLVNWESLNLLLESNVDYQCRTTIHWQLISPYRLIRLVQKLKNLSIENYSIQFSRTEQMLDMDLGYSLIPDSELDILKQQLITIMPSIILS